MHVPTLCTRVVQRLMVCLHDGRVQFMLFSFAWLSMFKKRQSCACIRTYTTVTDICTVAGWSLSCITSAQIWGKPKRCAGGEGLQPEQNGFFNLVKKGKINFKTYRSPIYTPRPVATTYNRKGVARLLKAFWPIYFYSCTKLFYAQWLIYAMNAVFSENIFWRQFAYNFVVFFKCTGTWNSTESL